ncbi:GNAT family N-acetyltransferase [Pseudolysobacter antarcticus]|uniref:GNAT family N-acetyltransferase n=1 Tax=Pseudolysobacter antarcticus TaxID=2511995 RepID=A0A411HNH2_9GAMM|nr:GNAT family N-acetyltransferase [Pseudolysobacter antarcticus]QBB72030.1 GNAT family N-acetyltransferase [Pseudolysobacter antarcticus]
MNTPRVILCDEGQCDELEAFLIERIYEFNSHATGYFDGRLIGGQVRSESGEVIAGFNGHTWGGCCVVSHLWVHESQRGHGLGQTLLQAAEAEASSRGCEQMVLSTHTFQAPAFYERLGYRKEAVISGQPKGHANVTYVKNLQRGPHGI